VVPASFDQPDNADRLCAMGVAAQIPMRMFTSRRSVHVARIMRKLVSTETPLQTTSMNAAGSRIKAGSGSGYSVCCGGCVGEGALAGVPGVDHGRTVGSGVGARCTQLAERVGKLPGGGGSGLQVGRGSRICNDSLTPFTLTIDCVNSLQVYR
jgi:hypothetical protein